MAINISIFWLVPVICIPLAGLLVMQYRFLRTLESKTASAERNWLRSAVENVALEIESYYRDAASRALTVPGDAIDRPDALAAHFAANQVEGAKTYFLVRFRNGSARYDLFDGSGEPKTVADEELQAIKLAAVSWHVVHKYGSVISAPQVAGDERDPQNRMILRPVTDPAARPSRGVPVLIGADEMARIDEAAQKLGLTEDALMESAGGAVAEVVHRLDPSGRLVPLAKVLDVE